jgi:hypothetical protein
MISGATMLLVIVGVAASAVLAESEVGSVSNIDSVLHGSWSFRLIGDSPRAADEPATGKQSAPTAEEQVEDDRTLLQRLRSGPDAAIAAVSRLLSRDPTFELHLLHGVMDNVLLGDITVHGNAQQLAAAVLNVTNAAADSGEAIPNILPDMMRVLVDAPTVTQAVVTLFPWAAADGAAPMWETRGSHESPSEVAARVRQSEEDSSDAEEPTASVVDAAKDGAGQPAETLPYGSTELLFLRSRQRFHPFSVASAEFELHSGLLERLHPDAAAAWGKVARVSLVASLAHDQSMSLTVSVATAAAGRSHVLRFHGSHMVARDVAAQQDSAAWHQVFMAIGILTVVAVAKFGGKWWFKRQGIDIDRWLSFIYGKKGKAGAAAPRRATEDEILARMRADDIAERRHLPRPGKK